MEKLILIKPVGRLGNLMFQYLVARCLMAEAPAAVIRGQNIPDFGIRPADHDISPASFSGEQIVVSGHVFDFRRAVQMLRKSTPAMIRIEWPCCRMEYISRHRGLAQRIFPIDPALPKGFGDDKLVIHIRGGDMFTARHPNYFPLPIAWYRELVTRFGLQPVFVGQVDQNPYGDALRREFPYAQFIYSPDRIADFNRLRTSRNIVLSISTFSWLAGWLSETASTIVLPIAGIFDSRDRPDIDLLPVSDRRYVFELFARETWKSQPEQMATIGCSSSLRQIGWPRLYRLRAALAVSRADRSRFALSLRRDLDTVFGSCYPPTN
jgi:hypothetical protein